MSERGTGAVHKHGGAARKRDEGASARNDAQGGAKGARGAQGGTDGIIVGGAKQSAADTSAARKRGAGETKQDEYDANDGAQDGVAGTQNEGAAHEAYLTLAGIVNDSITDGAGLRLAFFAQGCPRRCEGCHNPTALPFSGGTRYSVAELSAMAAKNPLLSGVTFSGGEPFAQSEGFTLLARELKKLRLNICIYTGYTFEELIGDAAHKALLLEADYLVDGQFILAKRDISLRFKGSSNQRILDVVQSIKCGRAIETKNLSWL
jgi:anaerobic ribonucleoside-triphosphate reductase activating protein